MVMAKNRSRGSRAQVAERADRTTAESIRAMLQYALVDSRQENFTELSERLAFAIQAADRLVANQRALAGADDHGEHGRTRRRTD
jgi:hypothetical protein